MSNDILSIAPMIDWSNRHFRYFMRLLAPNAYIYTEMQTPGAIQHNQERALAFSEPEKPLVLQLGGSDPKTLVESAKAGERYGYNEINLNMGCPSDRVQSGCFGVVLMKKPKRVQECIQAMKEAVSLPVTAKVRIGVDHEDSYEYFSAFVQELIEVGIDKLIVHARKAWLKGLSPKQNRTIPPLHYDYAYQIKKDHPELPVIINGNIVSNDDVLLHLNHVDGVMVGRLACQNPYRIAEIHHMLYPNTMLVSRQKVFNYYVDYLKLWHDHGVPLSVLLKPTLNLAHGLPGAKKWREQIALMQREGCYQAMLTCRDLLAQIETIKV